MCRRQSEGHCIVMQFAVVFFFVQQLEEDEVGNLLDVSDRIGDTTGPEDVGDVIELAA